MITRRSRKRTAWLAGAGFIGTMALAGCGGTTINPTQEPIAAATPAIYGIRFLRTTQAAFVETSGIESPDEQTGYVTGAVSSTAVPPPSVAGPEGTIPLGYPAGGQDNVGTFSNAAAPGTSVIFAAYVSNGQTTNGNVIPITSVSLTSNDPQWHLGTLALAFNQSKANNPSGSLPQAFYETSAFTLPFTTTGIHQVVATVTDSNNNVASTTFGIPVLAGSDSGVLVQVVDNNGNPIKGATVNITGQLPDPSQATTDDNGIGILFASAGSQTVTATFASTNSTPDTETLAAGTLFDSESSSDGPVAYQVTIPILQGSARKAAKVKR